MPVSSGTDKTIAKYLFWRIFQSSKNKLTNKLTGATCITVEKSLEHNVEKNKSNRNTCGKIPFTCSSKQKHSKNLLFRNTYRDGNSTIKKTKE